jgi:diguanylate cyclase (GGDEF)-like protein
VIVWNDLPDTLALAALVIIFVSLLRVQHERQLGVWVAGWVLIVLHFVAKLFNVNDASVVLDTIATTTLEVAGFAFLWAAVSRRLALRDLLIFAILVVPVLVETLLIEANVTRPDLYAVTIVAGAALILIVVGLERRVSPQDRLISAVVAVITTVLQLLVLKMDHDRGDLLNVILCGEYVAAGVLYWSRFPRPTTGVLTTVFGFVAWGLVFPVGWAQGVWFPHVQIDDTAWNIPKYIVAIGIIVTLLEQQMARSRYLAEHDDLTGLPNRRLLEAKLTALVQRGQARLALITVDLDRFKEVNDTLGHEAGDELLRTVAERFARHTGERNICARFGGDEFVIVARDIGERDEAAAFVGRLDAMLAEPIEICGEQIVPYASIGVALYPAEAGDVRSLLTRSDRDMYASKLRRRAGEERPLESRSNMADTR